ncbi:MAG: hypothetical protein LBT62_04010, partial [Deltaproteobacteria bacterium]|nr:hypothetical protein [Deltaproteobacteria bacterium]
NPVASAASIAGGAPASAITVARPFEEEQIERRELSPEDRAVLADTNNSLFSRVVVMPDSLYRDYDDARKHQEQD